MEKMNFKKNEYYAEKNFLCSTFVELIPRNTKTYFFFILENSKNRTLTTNGVSFITEMIMLLN